MPWTPCLRCGELAPAGESYCRRHRPSRSNPARGGGAGIRRFRREVMRRAGYRCQAIENGQRCETRGERQLEAHHVDGVAVSDDPARGVALCRPHHHAVERQRMLAAAARSAETM